MSYRQPAPQARPAPVFFARGGGERGADRTDMFLHRAFCCVLNPRPIELTHRCLGSERGFTHLCFCGLMWSAA